MSSEIVDLFVDKFKPILQKHAPAIVAAYIMILLRTDTDEEMLARLMDMSDSEYVEALVLHREITIAKRGMTEELIKNRDEFLRALLQALIVVFLKG